MMMAAFAAMVLLLAFAAPAAAHDAEAILREVAFEQRIGAELPADAVFRDERGRAVVLPELLDGRPAVLVFTQFDCPNLCPLILESLVASVMAAGIEPGEHYAVLVVSIDAREGPAAAARLERRLLDGQLREPQRAAWHFLTGEEASTRRLAHAAGVRFVYDAESDQFAHPAGVLVLTAAGQVSRYLFGIDFPPRDLRLALVEASRGTLGSVVDRVLLTCYRYDAGTGRYTPVVMTLVRAAGVLTMLGLGLMLALLLRAERRRPPAAGERTAPPGAAP